MPIKMEEKKANHDYEAKSTLNQSKEDLFHIKHKFGQTSPTEDSNKTPVSNKQFAVSDNQNNLMFNFTEVSKDNELEKTNHRNGNIIQPQMTNVSFNATEISQRNYSEGQPHKIKVVSNMKGKSRINLNEIKSLTNNVSADTMENSKIIVNKTEPQMKNVFSDTIENGHETGLETPSLKIKSYSGAKENIEKTGSEAQLKRIKGSPVAKENDKRTDNEPPSQNENIFVADNRKSFKTDKKPPQNVDDIENSEMIRRNLTQLKNDLVDKSGVKVTTSLPQIKITHIPFGKQEVLNVEEITPSPSHLPNNLSEHKGTDVLRSHTSAKSDLIGINKRHEDHMSNDENRINKKKDYISEWKNDDNHTKNLQDIYLHLIHNFD